MATLNCIWQENVYKANRFQKLLNEKWGSEGFKNKCAYNFLLGLLPVCDEALCARGKEGLRKKGDNKETQALMPYISLDELTGKVILAFFRGY